MRKKNKVFNEKPKTKAKLTGSEKRKKMEMKIVDDIVEMMMMMNNDALIENKLS